MRRTGRKRSVRTRVPTQREVLRDVMLSAAECETWLTLRELSLLTRYGEASISAQLRHLRKPRYGAFVIAKQHRRVRAIVGEEGRGPVVWEYQLRGGVQRDARPRSRRERSKLGGIGDVGGRRAA
jgi:hypothetical protein